MLLSVKSAAASLDTKGVGRVSKRTILKDQFFLSISAFKEKEREKYLSQKARSKAQQ